MGKFRRLCRPALRADMNPTVGPVHNCRGTTQSSNFSLSPLVWADSLTVRSDVTVSEAVRPQCLWRSGATSSLGLVLTPLYHFYNKDHMGFMLKIKLRQLFDFKSRDLIWSLNLWFKLPSTKLTIREAWNYHCAISILSHEARLMTSLCAKGVYLLII